MSKKVLFIGLALSLVLATLMPTPVLAAKPAPKFVDFNANGVITGITAGDVAPAGDSGRYRVIEREIDFYLLPGSSIVGPSALIYKANVELATQAGNLHGTMVTDPYTFEVNGTIEPLQFTGGWRVVIVDGAPQIQYEAYFEVNGKWTLVSGAQGNGDFAVSAYFWLTEDGHVVDVGANALEMSGKWKP